MRNGEERVPGTQEADPASLRIELLGRFRLSVDGEAADEAISTRGRELLALLVLEGGDRILRERIATRMWPDTSEAQARTNLRRELHHLKHEVPCSEDVIDTAGSHVRLRKVSSDLQNLREALDRARHGAEPELGPLTDVARLFTGELLPECFAEWLDPVRDRLHDEVVAALRRLVSLLEDRGDVMEAIRWARRLTELEPLDEKAYCAQMRLYARASDRAAAVHAFHRCANLLERELGASPSIETQALYRTLLDDTSEAPASLGSSRAASPATSTFVGRTTDRKAIVAAWQSRDGTRVACILGEPGIGKSRLADEVARDLEATGAEVLRARAYAMEGQLDYGPVVDWLRSPVILARLQDLEPSLRAELGRLLPELVGTRSQAAERSPSGDDAALRRRLFEAIARALTIGPSPVVLVLDDLQWCDAETLALVHFLSRAPSNARPFVLTTARANELGDNEAAQGLLQALRQEGHLVEIELGPLGAADVAALVEGVAGTLSSEAADRLYELSEGNPLFAIEALRADLHTSPVDPLSSAAPRSPGDLLHRSPRVRAVLGARLSQLDVRARELAECAATIGRAFDADVLGRAADLDERDLVLALDELWRRRIIREQSNLGYDFSHDALREAALQSLSPARARLLHRRVAQALELVRAANLDEVSALLASHYELAGMPDRAVGYYLRAARTAASVYAHVRAWALVDRALELVARRAHSRERDKEELQLLLAKSPSLRAVRGYADRDVLVLLARARVLAEGLEDMPSLFLTLRSLWASLLVSGDLHGTLEIGERLRELAVALPELEVESHHVLGGTLTNRGDFAQAIDHFESARRGYDPAAEHRKVSVFGSDLWVFNCAWEAHALWLFGLEDRALASAEDAVRMARAIGHAYSEAIAHAYATVLHYMRRDERACAEAAACVRDVCDRHGFAYYGHWGTLLGAWASRHADPESALETMRGAFAALDREQAWARRSIYLTAYAEVCMVAGRTDRAAEALDHAEARSRSSEERIWDPEIKRLRAELEPNEAVSHARQALEIAERMHARPLVVRSAVTLARALEGAGDRRIGRDIVRTALAALPEGGRSHDRGAALELLGGP
jgi:DNA-binding SARP family transcriptional activator